MDNRELERFIGSKDLSVSEAMQRIDNNACGILFLTDEQGKLVGCVTDGDVRRYLLAGGEMNGTAYDAANKSPKAARSLDEAMHLYHHLYYIVIPIIDEKGAIVDFYTGELGASIIKKRNPLGIPVVINAGGKGTRLDPYTKVLPKPLIPVGDLCHIPVMNYILL